MRFLVVLLLGEKRRGEKAVEQGKTTGARANSGGAFSIHATIEEGIRFQC